MDREHLDNLWDSVYYTSGLKHMINKIAPRLVEFLMASLLLEEEIEIGLFGRGGKKSASTVCYDIYNTDKILELRFRKDNKFELRLALENDDGDLESFYHTLNEKEAMIIPEGLRNLMKQAFQENEGMVYQTGSIQK